jgi:hypothetical protein
VTSLDLTGHIEGPFGIRAEDAATQSEIGVVGDLDRLAHVVVTRMVTTGPKISSRAIFMSGATSAKIVGSTRSAASANSATAHLASILLAAMETIPFSPSAILRLLQVHDPSFLLHTERLSLLRQSLCRHLRDGIGRARFDRDLLGGRSGSRAIDRLRGEVHDTTDGGQACGFEQTKGTLRAKRWSYPRIAAALRAIHGPERCSAF